MRTITDELQEMDTQFAKWLATEKNGKINERKIPSQTSHIFTESLQLLIYHNGKPLPNIFIIEVSIDNEPSKIYHDFYGRHIQMQHVSPTLHGVFQSNYFIQTDNNTTAYPITFNAVLRINTDTVIEFQLIITKITKITNDDPMNYEFIGEHLVVVNNTEE